MILYQLFCIQGLARGTSQTPERLSWWRSPSGCCRPPRPRCTCNSGKGCSRSTTWDAPRTCWTCRLARLLVVGLWHTVARPKKKWFAGWEIGSPIVNYHGLSCYHDHLPSAEVVSELMLLVFPNPIQVFRGKPDLEDYILGSHVGDFSPAIGQTALKISDRASSCQRWLDQLPFWWSSVQT